MKDAELSLSDLGRGAYVRKSLTCLFLTITNPGALLGFFAIFSGLGGVLDLGSVPYRPLNAVVGVIQVLNKRTGPFDATDERLLEAIASEIGVGLEVARLYGEAIERNAALERTRSELMLLIETERATGVIGWPAFTQQLREHPSFARRDLSSAPALRDGPLDIAMTDVPDGFPVHRTMSETAGGFAHTDLYIVDDAGRPVPDGSVGELWIRGIGVMAGYNKRERWETFDADGWYHTGDRVYRRTGDPRLFYVGRSTDLIKSAGANVSPLEVEAVLAERADIAQCVVLGVDHAERGEEVCAVIVPVAEHLDLEEVTAYTRDRLSTYKVPTRWVLTESTSIPTLPSGKLDRKTLRASIVDGTLG